MKPSYSFKFLNDKLNQRLISLLKKARVNHVVDANGVIHYSPQDEELVGNELICSIRNQVFPAWQVLSCPSDWADRYKQYMTKHQIPFSEEWSNNQLWFLLPRKYRPHSWKLGEEPVKRRKQPKYRNIHAPLSSAGG